MAAIATWTFGESIVAKAKSLLSKEVSATESVVKSISELEDDISTGPYLVGRGGFPNSDGVLQCDAAIMSGESLHFGAVAALEGVSTPIRVAESVMKHSEHSVLVGAGAQKFAKENGFVLQNNDDLISDEGRRLYQEHLCGKEKNETNSHSFDTLGLISLDSKNNMSSGVTTSGMSFKYPGRVGDSPLPGCGLYADDAIGAACATGDGDHILKFCPCYHIVMLMKMSKSPNEACKETVQQMCDRWSKMSHKMFEIGVIAMNNKGEFGAATTITEWTDNLTGQKFEGFPYAVWNPKFSENVMVKVVKAVQTL